MFWFAVDADTKQRLGRDPQVSISMWLGSGYSLEKDIKAKRDRLENVCKAVVADPNFVTRDITGDSIKETFCNRAVWEIGAEMGCDVFKKRQMYARDIIKHCKSSGDWTEVSPERALEHAKRGNLTICGKRYPDMDHVAAVYPTEMLFSGSWNKYVLVVANVGKKNGIMKVSEAFPVAEGEPQFWAYLEDAL
jgi:hypothetical protein